MTVINLGIIGGGQLGSMLATAAKKLNIKTTVYCDDKNAPAQDFCDDFRDLSCDTGWIPYKHSKHHIPIYSQNEGFLDGMLEHSQLPKWLNQEDLTYYVNQFKNSGMRGPLNRYRCIDIDWEELRFLSDKKIEKPACFITGELDPVNFMILEGLRNLKSDKPDNELFSEHLYKNYSDLRVLEIIKECGHWTQQEKPKEVNKILLDFLKKI